MTKYGYGITGYNRCVCGVCAHVATVNQFLLCFRICANQVAMLN